MKNFASTVQVGPVFGGLDMRPPRAPVSHAWAYRDFPDDALAVLLFVRHARCTELLGWRVQLPTVLEEGFPLRRMNGIGEPIGDSVGIDNLATSLGDSLSAQCLYRPECGLSSGPAWALLDRTAWEYPPSRGDA
ncbi:hypothetical protein CRG98_013304 [Punica granatum]|uniref:Uncharacterized protein n=1 Tax=Punica granatum TaxID=22663 RepID=A0A2I0KCS7_PUNGR|nr:hypothetical protein CRG98_013304 [Punica granatum]